MTDEAEGRIDFQQPILDLNDEEIKADEKVQRLGDFCINALMATPQDDKADGVVKLKRWNLARKIQGKAGDDEPYASMRLNSKQKKMILDTAEKVYATLVYARVYEALEGTTEESEDE